MAYRNCVCKGNNINCMYCDGSGFIYEKNHPSNIPPKKEILKSEIEKPESKEESNLRKAVEGQLLARQKYLRSKNSGKRKKKKVKKISAGNKRNIENLLKKDGWKKSW